MQFRSATTGAGSPNVRSAIRRFLNRGILLLACISAPTMGLLLATNSANATPTITQQVGTLKCAVPGPLDRFVLHGTMAIAPRTFARNNCPLKVFAPDGTPLNTQWELVAELQDWMIVEVRAMVENNSWSGMQYFPVHDGETNDYSLDGFALESLATVVLENKVKLNLLDQLGQVHALSLSGINPNDELFRYGPNTLTVRRSFDTAFGGFQAWFTVNADRRQVELVINWHNGSLPAKPDVYFTTATLDVPAGWSHTPFLPDPTIGSQTLVKPDLHVLPQRMERSFRLVLHPDNEAPLVELEGWAVGDWTRGGYMPQNIGLPDLSHTVIDLSVQKDLDFSLLASNSPTLPGDIPVSHFWPAQGVKYGGMTSGTDIHHYEGVLPAVSAQSDGILSLYVEQLRYGSRQMGCIYEADGQPLRMDDYLNTDGSRPWDIYANVFLSSPPKDTPFDFADTGSGSGTANYDPSVYAPIDNQHMVRRTKANKALVWLTNDPLARQYCAMDAALARMTFYEGNGGEILPKTSTGLGIAWGRGEAWAADIIVTAYATGKSEYRQRTANWFPSFISALERTQMPNGLFSAMDDGKVADSPPYGDGTTADYWAHRSNEQILLAYALRGIQEVVGHNCGPAIASSSSAIWKFAWKDGTSGVLDRYPAGTINGPRFTSKSEIPSGLTDSVYFDPYHVPGAFAQGVLAGGNLLDMANMITTYAGASDIFDAKVLFESWGTDQIFNRAPALWILQNLLP